ncbi:MAG: hypothetical protein EPO32_12210 [Anaerolineae bacterium]|nr:MAG: hypothetical protein EPO32_12210 [Anaerolineae bacterium]
MPHKNGFCEVTFKLKSLAHLLITMFLSERFLRNTYLLLLSFTVLFSLSMILDGVFSDNLTWDVLGFLGLFPAWISSAIIIMRLSVDFLRRQRVPLIILFGTVLSIGMNQTIGMHYFTAGAILGARLSDTDQIVVEARELMKTCGRDLDFNENVADYLIRCPISSRFPPAIAKLNPMELEIYSGLVLIRKRGFGDWAGFSVRSEGEERDCQLFVTDEICWAWAGADN